MKLLSLRSKHLQWKWEAVGGSVVDWSIMVLQNSEAGLVFAQTIRKRMERSTGVGAGSEEAKPRLWIVDSQQDSVLHTKHTQCIQRLEKAICCGLRNPKMHVSPRVLQNGR